MSFQDVADLNCDTCYALGGTDRKSGKKNPTSIEGFYIGTRQVASPKSKTGFAALHVFQTKNGNVGVWGKTNLDQKMGSVKAGQLCRVSFVGMVETKNNPMYKYRVQVDPTQTIEVANSDSEEAEYTGADDDASEAGADDYESEPDLDEEETRADEIQDSRQPALAAPRRAVDPDRQARTQSLLAGRNKRVS